MLQSPMLLMKYSLVFILHNPTIHPCPAAAMLPVSRFPALLAASAGALLMLLQTSSGQEDVVRTTSD